MVLGRGLRSDAQRGRKGVRNRLEGAEQGLRKRGRAVLREEGYKRAGDPLGGTHSQQTSTLMGTSASPTSCGLLYRPRKKSHKQKALSFR